MKKTITAWILLLILVLTACAPEAGNNAANVPANNTQPGGNTTTSDPVVPENKDQERYETLYESGIHSADDLAFFLNGTWTLIPKGSQSGPLMEYGDLTFDYGSRKAVFELKIGGASKAEMAFTSDKLYADMNNASEDVIQFFVTGADGTILEKSNGLIGSNGKYQVFFCRCQDSDIMFLRPLGYRPVEITLSVFDEGNQTSDCCFVFIRKGGTKSLKTIDDKFYEGKRFCAVTFMALRWVDLDGACYLLPVNFEFFEEDLFDQKEDFVRFSYVVNDAMYCIRYEDQENTSVKDSAPYDPQLVEVTVEGDDKITELHRYKYAAFGIYYHQFEADDQGPSGSSDSRDPAVFGRTDGLYLGYWTDANNSANTLVINEASPQTGGYKLDFMFGDVRVNGYANIAEDNSLFINQGYVNGNIKIEGVITGTGDTVHFLVTACDWIAAPAGTTFDYIRDGVGDPGPNGGEGSEYRDPETFGFCDWFFPKTWYLRDDHNKTLTVTAESLQVGGYKVVFTAPDGGSAECYGYPEDGMYIILGQAFVNGTYRFTGYLEQVDEVFMRLIITDSQYASLPVGTILVYDPKK